MRSHAGLSSNTRFSSSAASCESSFSVCFRVALGPRVCMCASRDQVSIVVCSLPEIATSMSNSLPTEQLTSFLCGAPRTFHTPRLLGGGWSVCSRASHLHQALSPSSVTRFSSRRAHRGTRSTAGSRLTVSSLPIQSLCRTKASHAHKPSITLQGIRTSHVNIKWPSVIIFCCCFFIAATCVLSSQSLARFLLIQICGPQEMRPTGDWCS